MYQQVFCCFYARFFLLRVCEISLKQHAQQTSKMHSLKIVAILPQLAPIAPLPTHSSTNQG